MGLARKTGQLLIWPLLAVSSQAATVTDSGTGTKSDTAQAQNYTSNAFTPAAGDLLVVFVTASGTGAPGTMTDSQGLGFTKIAGTGYSSNTNTVYVFVSNSFASASSMTVTFDCHADPATGCVIQVARVSGMSRAGASAVLQSEVAHAPGGTTPAATFAAAVQIGNPTLGLVGNVSNPAALTPPTPNWTERDDTGYITPATGAEYVSLNKGFTGTTITWGAASASNHGEVIVELDTSAAPTPSNTLAELCQKIDCGTLFQQFLKPRIEQVVPFISNITSDGSVFIKGSGFGNEEGELFLVWTALGPLPDSGNELSRESFSWETLSIPSERNKDFWTPTSVLGHIPHIEGKEDKAPWLLIKTKAGRYSNMFVVNFRAQRKLTTLQSDDVGVSCSYEADVDSCNSHYNSDSVPFCSNPFVAAGQEDDTIVGYHWTCVGDSEGTDSYKASLQNGWLFENAAFTNLSGGNSAAMTGFQSGTTSMNVKVSWSNENVPYVLYRMIIQIEGPIGVPHNVPHN